MGIKKSELYSSLWSSCNELRGGMDASQYKDYVLVMLFVKYVSDKYVGVPFAPITIPEGASFQDMVALKGTREIGDDINKKIIAPLAEANKLSGMPDFNDATKLGDGKEMIDRLTNLIAIFERKELDFSKNRADGDDILGDAYEYLMRHFATESGKSKGQFYTPSEVSQVMAKIIGINSENTTAETTVYDPTCGSGSLLLKVADEAESSISLYGQEKDLATSGLAYMNMILHNNPLAVIKQGNTLAKPLFENEQGGLKTFDYIVANPPFSDKRWGNGVNIETDSYGRFSDFGTPPEKNGDYAYLLHIVKSLKRKGKGACILPHGVLFRGNAEADIRKKLIQKGYIKGIIGLPANLFFGTGIPACIIVLDKENAVNRKGIFMIDASEGFVKDGNKNRLRSMDIHKIIDTFNSRIEINQYSKMISFDEIEKNEFNLNIPRYIDSQENEDLHDIEAHLLGGVPNTDIETLSDYWNVFPTMKKSIFEKSLRRNYSNLKIKEDEIKKTIYEHPEFIKFREDMNYLFVDWKNKKTQILKALQAGFKPKELLITLSEDLLMHYTNKDLISKYDVYQHFMNYWREIMQDDCYLVAADGWKAETYRIIVENKQKKEIDKGWTCDLVPKELVINRYFIEEKLTIETLDAEIESLESQLMELEEEYGEDDGALNSIGNKTEAINALREYTLLTWKKCFPENFKTYEQLSDELDAKEAKLNETKNHILIKELQNSRGNVTKKAINDQLKSSNDNSEIILLRSFIKTTDEITKMKKKIKGLTESASAQIQKKIESETNDEDDYSLELTIINTYLEVTDKIAEIKKMIKSLREELNQKLYLKYPELKEEEIKRLVVDDKWMASIEQAIQTEMYQISQRLTKRISELARRYEKPLPVMIEEVSKLEKKVASHLERMGYV